MLWLAGSARMIGSLVHYFVVAPISAAGLDQDWERLVNASRWHLPADQASAYLVTVVVMVAALSVALMASVWRPADHPHDGARLDHWTSVTLIVSGLGASSCVTVSVSAFIELHSRGIDLLVMNLFAMGIMASTLVRTSRWGRLLSLHDFEIQIKIMEDNSAAYWKKRRFFGSCEVKAVELIATAFLILVVCVTVSLPLSLVVREAPNPGLVSPSSRTLSRFLALFTAAWFVTLSGLAMVAVPILFLAVAPVAKSLPIAVSTLLPVVLVITVAILGRRGGWPGVRFWQFARSSLDRRIPKEQERYAKAKAYFELLTEAQELSNMLANLGGGDT